MIQLDFDTIENILKKSTLYDDSALSDRCAVVASREFEPRISLCCEQNEYKCNFSIYVRQGNFTLADKGYILNYSNGEKSSGDIRVRELFEEYGVPALYDTALKQMQDNERLVEEITKKYSN